MKQSCAGLRTVDLLASHPSQFVRYVSSLDVALMTVCLQISDVVIGWESDVFKKCPNEMLEKPWKCISIRSEKRTFDCSLKTEDDVITWCRGLMALVCIRPGKVAPTVDSMKKRIQMYRESFK